MQQSQPPQDATVTIKGLVVPAQWGRDGEVLAVSISTFDETEYLLEDGGLARELFGKLHQVVSVIGKVRVIQGGRKMIEVQSYTMEKGPGLGKTLLTLAVAGFFGLAAVSPVLAADEKAPAPAMQEDQAAKPAPKMAEPDAKAPKKAVKKSAKKTKKAGAKKAVKANPEVKTAQEALIAAGYAKVKADGMMGKSTKKAIKAFQKKNGLKVTGKLDEATKKALNL